MGPTELVLTYADAAALALDFDSNLQKGRAFIPGASTLAALDAVSVLLVHAASGMELRFSAEAVWINPDPQNPGTGVQFMPFGAEEREALRAFVEGVKGAEAEAGAGGMGGAEAEAGAGGMGGAEAEAEVSMAGLEGEELGPSSSGTHRNLYDRVRGLSSEQRAELARQGTLPERVALERAFGGSVWEGLLQNPTLTVREVARMAKSGSLPTSLVSAIVQNRGWLADPAVQAALLANPRVSGAHLERVLRALPQAELSRVSTQQSYRMLVRAAAKRLIVR